MPLNLSFLQYVMTIGVTVLQILSLALSAKEVRVWGLELLGKFFQKLVEHLPTFSCKYSY